MPLKNGYAILKGHVIAGVRAKHNQDHYSVRVVDEELDYRIAINIRSNAQNFGSDLWFYLNEDFQHPLLSALRDLPLGRRIFPPGTSAEERRNSGICLDFIRMNLFDRSQMKIFPSQIEGADNDLNDRIDALVQRVAGDEQSLIYAFGEPWSDEDKKDKVFGFRPGNGVHDIHMNQGDLTGKHDHEDGVYQDGGLLFYLPVSNQFVAYFTKFQSQSWHTDDKTGHAISGEGEDIVPVPDNLPGGNRFGGGNPMGPGQDPDLRVRIVAAMVNPIGPAPERETVTLLNTTAAPVDLTGWSLRDRQKNAMPLAGELAAGATQQIAVEAPLQLGNSGGIITLVDSQGIKVHGVSYTKAQASHEGETITFP